MTVTVQTPAQKRAKSKGPIVEAKLTPAELRLEDANVALGALRLEAQNLPAALTEAIAAEDLDRQLDLHARRQQLAVLIPAAERGVYRAEIDLLRPQVAAAFEERARTRKELAKAIEAVAEAERARGRAAATSGRADSAYHSLHWKMQAAEDRLAKAQEPTGLRGVA